MSKRLMGWREISAEKIPRSRAWLKARARTDPKFPKPAIQGAGQSPTLYWEHEIDAWLEHFAESSHRGPAKEMRKPPERKAAVA